MEDFPKQTINLIHTNGSQEVKTTNDAISKIPIQFLLKVVPSIPSCTEGLYLPRFLPPTPDNRAQIYTVVNQTVEIPIMAEATQSTFHLPRDRRSRTPRKTPLAAGHVTLKAYISVIIQQKITELLFSGPYNVVKNTSGSGSFTLKWTPSQNESEQSHSICFVVQASHSNILYQSELRCVAVLIDQPPPPTPSPTTPSPPPTTPSPPPPPPPRKFDRS
ncbi:junction-mediating and -regulatory protein-like isoform X1 [Kryptolebias marmoratus]|uniref:junction-mediating and -regulatory protein-like isoform X1 n=1 Tax=Kryptolebias marmoratus TaxID=37003 RepID=UPI0018ACE34A|nr:junction-mediating and -regulatory protein-like isoform X1 [Kryptolebias marmoratus]XP_037832284.1 junction-mediating and -regulatory protein-like isoform X1 [Kryptolebias marmoratus]